MSLISFCNVNSGVVRRCARPVTQYPSQWYSKHFLDSRFRPLDCVQLTPSRSGTLPNNLSYIYNASNTTVRRGSASIGYVGLDRSSGMAVVPTCGLSGRCVVDCLVSPSSHGSVEGGFLSAKANNDTDKICSPGHRPAGLSGVSKRKCVCGEFFQCYQLNRLSACRPLYSHTKLTLRSRRAQMQALICPIL